MAFIDSNNHPNANESHVFGVIIIGIHVGLSLLNFFLSKSHTGSWLGGYVAASAFCAIAAVINFKNTFETNDSWKTWIGVAAVIGSLAINIIPIASQNGG